MEIYVVICGEFDEAENCLVTTNLNVALDYISKHLTTKHTWTRFSCMECWKDGVKQYTYGTWNGDRCNLRKPMTVNELAKDIDRHRENVGY